MLLIMSLGAGAGGRLGAEGTFFFEKKIKFFGRGESL
jgi:hypothetical protein